MRYSCTALVLATALISRVAAGPVHHGHQHVHEKKVAALKVEEAEADADLEKKELSTSIHYTNDWATLTIWKTLEYTYSEDQTWGESTRAADNVVPASTTPAAVVPTTTPPPPPAPATTSASTSAPSPAPAPSSSSSPSPSPSPSPVPASEPLTSGDASKILSLGFAAVGLNSRDSSGNVWFGDDGPYTTEFNNDSGEDLIVVVWGPAASWVNANAPLITYSLPSGGTVTISFANGQSGAWSAIYSDTTLVNGQVSNSWAEYTFTPQGVVDISKEVNMNGHSMSVEGPDCKADMNTCVFKCSDSSATSCEFGYELLNCSPGSQPGAQDGTYGGAASGGCGWLGASSAHFTATFS